MRGLLIANEPVEKPVVHTAFLLRLFCLLFVSDFACFWWEFQDKNDLMTCYLNHRYNWRYWALSAGCLPYLAVPAYLLQIMHHTIQQPLALYLGFAA